MKRALKIAGFGLLAGSAVAIAVPNLALARDGGFAGFGGQRAPMTFAELDANGDAQITEDDLQALADARFGEQDANGDGALTADEVAAGIVAKMTERMAAAPEGQTQGKNRPAPTQEQMQARADQIAKRVIDRMDADGNGTIEATEMQPKNGFGRFVDRMDTDDDNAVSKAEYDEAKAERRGHGDRGDRKEPGGKGGHGDRGGYGKGDRGDRAERGDRGDRGQRGMWGERPAASPMTDQAPAQDGDET